MQTTKYCVSFAVIVCLLTGCAMPAEVPEKPENVSSAELHPETAIAEPSEFADLKDGDRILLRSTKNGRLFSELYSEHCVVASWPKTNGDAITALPEYTAILTYESAEDGAFRLRNRDAYLRSEPNGYYLEYGQKDEYSLWKCGGNDTMINCYATTEETGTAIGIHYDSDSNIFEMAIPSDEDIASAGLKPYLVKDNYELPKDDGRGYRLPVFETSDIHGYLADAGSESVGYRLAWIADKVNDSRSRLGSERDETVVLLDGGDIYQGNTLSNLLNGKPLLEAFAEMRYDAVTIGNHEFDWNVDTVVDTDSTMADYQDKNNEPVENRIPVILSNFYQNGEKTLYARDYVVLEKTAVDKNGNELPVKIGVIGYCEDYSTSIKASLFSGLGFEVRDEPEVLTELSRKLREEEGCDAVILLSHTEGSKIAEQVPEDASIDLILAGHTHWDDIGLNSQGIPFTMPAGYAASYCYAELVFNDGENGSAEFARVADLHTVSVDEETDQLIGVTESDDLDSAVVAITEDALLAVEDIMNERLGYIKESLTRYDYIPGSGNRVSACGNFYCDVLRKIVDADVGFYNLYGQRDDLLLPNGSDRRDIIMDDIYRLFPFSNPVYKFRITYEEFMRVLDYAMTKNGARTFSMITGIDVYYADGTVNAIVKDGIPLYVNGVWMIDGKTETITVAVSEFSATRSNPDSGLDNPFVEWADTDRLLESDKIDTVAAREVLLEEAKENKGLIKVDTRPHFINRVYEP